MNDKIIDSEAIRVMGSKFGMIVEELRDGYVKVKAPAKEEHMNYMGITYGGWLFHIADLTAGIAFLSDGKTRGVTASGDIQFLRAGDCEQTITCIAEVIKRGRTLDYVEAQLYSEAGKMLARANFVFARVKD